MNKGIKLLNNSIIFAIGNLGSKVISIILIPLFTYFLTTKEYGTIDLIMTTLNLLLPVVSLSIFDGVMRYSMDKEYQSEEVFSAGMIVTFCSTFLIILLSLIFNILGYKYAILFGMLLIMQTYQSLFSQYSRAIGKVKIFASNGIFLSLLTSIFSVIFLAALRMGVEGYLYSLILSFILSNIYLAKKLNIKDIIILKINIPLTKMLLLFSIPLIPNALAWWLTNASSRYFILGYVGASANGLFALSNKIPSLLSIFTSIFNQAWQLSAIEEYEEGNKDNFNSKVLDYYTQFLFISIAFLLPFTKIIFHYFISIEFQQAALYIPIMLISVFYSSLSSFLGASYIAAKKTKGVFYTTIVGGIISIIANFLLIPKYNIFGAGISITVSFMIISLIRYVDSKKNNNMKIDISKFVLSHIIIIIQSALFYFDNNAITVILQILVILFFFVINKIIFIEILKKIVSKIRKV
ncbi:polysaccharide biosynthesis C-terminal domain-containing protein [Vagococcus lutrae]|uniref:lipopolysaccharide biosynthesis protein n=1 Tax=Vagococcus lutrae TaxID=81947 RepID=UPI002890D2BC|nr:polysaccharide biosynthesis C-terminal domain-containing protein [Vagococcus lutrae]MDT2817401.1 polysaccharide biosynthesis C-terminal domain-containing protein [Vagococcus lutrae]